jgi:Lysylphosphatidylglycerol synthase TM region
LRRRFASSKSSDPVNVTSRARRRALSLTASAVGLALFVYAVRLAGVGEILDGIRRVGWGLVLIISLGGIRFLVRAQCWRLCLPGAAQLTFGHALVAFLAGDAVGSVTPLGLLASEPTKVFLTRHHLATRESVASLTLENLLYSASVIAMVAFGATLLLMTSPLPSPLRRSLIAALLVSAGAVCLVPVLLRMRVVGAGLQSLPARFAALGVIAGEVRQFSLTQPGRLAEVFLLDLLYHAIAVLEVFVTLEWLMGANRPTLVMAVVFETLNRIITVVFKFVPFRVGVDEAFTGALAPLVAVDPASGVALAVVRKVRSLFWAGVGLGAVALHPERREGRNHSRV